MHELGITENIISIVLKHGEKEDAKKITKITLKIGELTQVVGDCIQFYFDQLSKDTIAENAELVIEYIPIKVRCADCGSEKEASNYDFTCPSCGAICTEFTAGREFLVDDIEVE